MFEFDDEVVNQLRQENPEFESLFKMHLELKEQVRQAELGITAMDDLALGMLKKEKLLAKDKMAALIEQFRKEHA